MIAIPNMEKPKRCKECIDNMLNVVVDCYPDDYAEYKDGNKIACPLIEIVTCGECKWFIKQGEGNVGKCKYRTRPILYCLPTDFCSYGERKKE